MSYAHIWIHAVWTTRRRLPLLHKSFRQELFQHIVVDARSKRIDVDRINGHCDHVHMLFKLKSTQTLSQVMNQVKGESSRWINKNSLCSEPFAWQNEYFAVSVEEKGVYSLRRYIDTQEEHHQTKTFQEEQERLFNCRLDNPREESS